MAFITKRKDIYKHIESKLNENSIIGYFGTYIPMQKKYDLIVPNCFYTIDLEADILAFRKSGFRDEIEIKTSLSDFKNDAKKTVEFRTPKPDGKRGYIYENMTKYEALEKGRLLNYFWYLVPHGLITVDDIPDFAGLMYIECRNENKMQIRVIRDAKRLHGNKAPEEDFNKSLRKLGYRYWNLVEKNMKKLNSEDIK